MKFRRWQLHGLTICLRNNSNANDNQPRATVSSRSNTTVDPDRSSEHAMHRNSTDSDELRGNFPSHWKWMRTVRSCVECGRGRQEINPITWPATEITDRDRHQCRRTRAERYYHRNWLIHSTSGRMLGNVCARQPSPLGNTPQQDTIFFFSFTIMCKIFFFYS